MNDAFKKRLVDDLKIEHWLGLCVDDPQKWDAPDGEKWRDDPKEEARIAEAIAICNICPFQTECASRAFNLGGRVSGVIAGKLIPWNRTKMPTEAKEL